MIAFVGDVHRSFGAFAQLVCNLPAVIQVVIQVGDLGLRPEDLAPPEPTAPRLNRPVWYVTGNHDHEPLYRGLTVPTEMWKNLIYVPRGTVLQLDGRRIAFLGGGDSVIDRAYRCEGVDWWPDERVTPGDVSRFFGAGPVDMLVAHTPPAFVYPSFRLPPDPSAWAVEDAWEILGRPMVVSGHFHRPRHIGPARVLGELELLVI